MTTETLPATTDEPSPTHAMMVTPAMLQAAVEMGAEGRDNLRFLLEAQEKERARWAAQQYSRALLAMQRVMPRVKRDGYNKHTRSHYPKLESVDRHIRPLYTEHGFEITFTTEPVDREGWSLHVAIVTHADGHERRHAAEFPCDSKGPQGGSVKTELHGMGSALTYAQRRLTCMAFGVVTDEDDDGNAAGAKEPETVTAEQAANLQALAEEVGADEGRFLKWVGADSWETIPFERFPACVDALERKRSQ